MHAASSCHHHIRWTASCQRSGRRSKTQRPRSRAGKPMRAPTAVRPDAEKQLQAFIRKFDPTDQRLIRAVRACTAPAASDGERVGLGQLQLLRDRLLPDRTAVGSRSCRWRPGQTASGCASSTAPACPIPRRCCSAPAGRRDSFASTRPRCSNVRRSRRWSRPPLARHACAFQPAVVGKTRSFARYRRNSGDAGNQRDQAAPNKKGPAYAGPQGLQASGFGLRGLPPAFCLSDFCLYAHPLVVPQLAHL